jgi:cytochrome c peroxidase
VAVAPGGKVAIALAGVGELAFAPKLGEPWQRLTVGTRPTAVAASAKGRLYVADTFGDTIVSVDLDTTKVLMQVALRPAPQRDAADRGEMLFYDARLSHDGWFSCHSCHTDGHSNGLLADTLGDGSYGNPKRVLSLLGVKDTGPWAWNGSKAILEDQVHSSVDTTMQGAKLNAAHAIDLIAYLRTLQPAPALGRFAPLSSAAVQRGREVFRQQECARCHVPPSYTSPKVHTVRRSETENISLSPPSLRGVSQGGPYFHDGRVATLREVFTRERHQLWGNISPQDVEDLLALLHEL